LDFLIIDLMTFIIRKRRREMKVDIFES